MLIAPINYYATKYNAPSFGVNLSSPKLKFKEDDFYVRIRGYGHHSGWAKKIKETADRAVIFIRDNCNFEETLKKITEGVIEANKLPLDIEKRTHTGILRTDREGWRYGSSWNGCDLVTRYSENRQNRYNTYAERLNYTAQHPLKNPYKGIALTRPVVDADYGRFLDHAGANYINGAFVKINKIYSDLHNKYILNEVKDENVFEVNNSIAEIRWILAHATPWERDFHGSTRIRAPCRNTGRGRSRYTAYAGRI